MADYNEWRRVRATQHGRTRGLGGCVSGIHTSPAVVSSRKEVVHCSTSVLVASEVVAPEFGRRVARCGHHLLPSSRPPVDPLGEACSRSNNKARRLPWQAPSFFSFGQELRPLVCASKTGIS